LTKAADVEILDADLKRRGGRGGGSGHECAARDP